MPSASANWGRSRAMRGPQNNRIQPTPGICGGFLHIFGGVG
jgi:uncharacterized protein (DUF433 family)